MTGTDIEFRNRPNEDGTFSSFIIKDCLIAQSGSPTIARPQIIIHLPKSDASPVGGAWVNYDGGSYHVIGTTAKSIEPNTPTRWNRYCVAERMY